MTPETWERRFKERLMNNIEGGVDQETADVIWGTCDPEAMMLDQPENPEQAADDELASWEDDVAEFDEFDEYDSELDD